MTDPPASGWRPDPYGRAEQRYWDGTRFTASIRNDGNETDDPLGATATIPFTNPTGITTGASTVAPVERAGPVTRLRRWFARLVHRT